MVHEAEVLCRKLQKKWIVQHHIRTKMKSVQCDRFGSYNYNSYFQWQCLRRKSSINIGIFYKDPTLQHRRIIHSYRVRICICNMPLNASGAETKVYCFIVDYTCCVSAMSLFSCGFWTGGFLHIEYCWVLSESHSNQHFTTFVHSEFTVLVW